MPKDKNQDFPVSALFGIAKPSGPSSMSVVNDLKRLVSASKLFMDEKIARENAEKLYSRGSGDVKEKGKGKKRGRGKAAEAKIGQGGTLDPLADGVLVIGVNKGTKRLSDFLDCVKEYRTTGLLGCETDSYDSEGAQVRAAPWRHVTRAQTEDALGQFRGNIEQTPPIFSALKMDGKPLYEYARSGTPLPRPIARRPVTVHSLALTHWIPGSEHNYTFPEKKFTDEERKQLARALAGKELPADAEIKDEPEAEPSVGEGSANMEADGKDERPPAFVLSMSVSGGTYVRCIAHDLGHAVGSAAHVVTLTRSRQGRFVLGSDAPGSTPVLTTENPTVPVDEEATGETGPVPVIDKAVAAAEEAQDADGAKKSEKAKDVECIPWDIFARAIEQGADEKPDADGWREWERAVMERWELV